MTPGPHVRWERDGTHTARLTISHSRLRNALTLAMYDELEKACDEIDADDTVRVTVVRGAGETAFAAGTDIREFAAFTSGADGIAYEHRVGRAVDRLAALRMPAIAVVRGPAVGAGTILAASCDIVLATPDATFGAPIGRTLGNCLAPAALARLYAGFGRSRVLHALYTAQLITAAQAHEAGFVSEITPPEALEDRVTELSSQIARCAPLTLAALKEADRRALAAMVPAHADDLYAMCYGSRDFAEGVTAFLTKRTPVWEGR
ncbi:enoyl-CoA hydratase [Streptomyces avermitilis]|uniref:enoyl-CoA hydratase n=1 Tax=Streptomyces avermitilis TaxID=33903 RepID=UPI0033BC4B20